MLLRGYVRTIKDGQPVPDGTEVRVRSHRDRSLLATLATSGGRYEKLFQGSPGPYTVEVEYDGETHVSSSQVVGMSGPVNIGGLPLVLRQWTDGYIQGVLDELKVTSPGAGMKVDVGGGAAMVRGILYDQYSSLPLAIAPPDTQARIDLVVVQVVPAGVDPDTEGTATILVKKGTPTTSPQQPGLTQTGALWEIPLAAVTVDAGVSSVATNKVADLRQASNVQISDGYLTTAMYGDKSVTEAKLADGAVTTPKLADNSVTSEKIVNRTIATTDIAQNAITEYELSQPVVDKLNANGYHHDTAPFAYVGVTSSVHAIIRTQKVTLSKGRWLLILTYEGQVASQTGDYTAVQLALANSGAGGLWHSHAVTNVEAEGISAHASLIRYSPVTLTSTTTVSVTLGASKMGGAAAKVMGFLGIHAIQLGV